MFFMGLFLGLAVTSMLGMGIMFAMVANGKVGGMGPVAAANNNLPANLPTNANQPSAPAQPVKEVTDKDHIRGPKDAKVTLIEYSDFQCPYCKRHAPTLEQLLKKYPKDVRLVYRHYPLTFIHPQAQPAAEASECGAKLGGTAAFWKLHDAFIAENADLSRAGYIAAAKAAGLNEADFTKCIDNGETKSIVDEQTASGNASGVDGTPATFINGQLVSGAVPFEQLDQMVAQAGAKQ